MEAVILRIPISDIIINPGRRGIRPEQVKKLADSIAVVGLLNPITLDQADTLIAGLHRLEAAKLLGWTEIEYTVSGVEGLEAELAEIDENVVRTDLSTVAGSDLLLRRKEIYEQLHPETRQGKRNRQTVKNEETSLLTAKPFSQDTAEKLGVSRRTVEKKIKIAKDLSPDARKVVEDHAIGTEAAFHLARLPQEQQAEAASLLASGVISSMKGYRTSTTESSTEAPPFQLGGKCFATIQESVQDLKNMDKDCSCTPDIFLAAITEFVKRFQSEISCYADEYYAPVFPALSPVQLRYLRQQMDTIRNAADQLYILIEGKIENE